LLILSTLVLSLAACSSVRRIEVATAPIERIPLTLPDIDTLTLDEVNWIIVTPENVQQVLRELEGKNFDIVLFALTDNGYENISVNIAKIKKMVLQQKAVIAAYKRYYEMQSSEIEKYNQKEKEAAKETLINKLKSLFN
jgi:predicted MPP superfamily phosphohydrolase